MKTRNAISLVATLVPLLAACGLAACGSSKNTTNGTGGGGGDAATAIATDGGSPASFEACIASLQPSCVVSQQDTAEKLQAPCASLTMIPVPLEQGAPPGTAGTDGGLYGPMTIKAGPYGGKIEWNQGAGTPFVNPVNSAEPVCLPTGVKTFNEPASVNAEILNVRMIDYSLYTIFRPACMKDGETYPVITWANGTCGLTHGYAPLLSTLASHGFVIFASNSTWTGTAPTNMVQVHALDYAKSLNEDPTSVLYQRLNMDKIGAMGHSQGAGATATASSDPRIKSLIFFSGGTSNNKPFMYVSADRDIGSSTAASLASGTNGATQPGAWIYYHQVLVTGGTSTGHLVLMEQPERVVDMTIAWWQYQLNGDQEAKKMFIGDSCGLCNNTAEFEYGHNTLLQ
jgi:hypothetical protein